MFQNGIGDNVIVVPFPNLTSLILALLVLLFSLSVISIIVGKVLSTFLLLMQQGLLLLASGGTINSGSKFNGKT